MNWWYARGSEKQGPIEDALFREMVRDGRVAPDDLVWNESMATWMRAGNVPGLLSQTGQTIQAEIGGNGGDTPIMDLFQKAYDCMSGRWWIAIGVALLIHLAVRLPASIPYLGIVWVLVAVGPLRVGLARFFLAYLRRQEATVEIAFSGFSDFWRNFTAFLLALVFVMLWSLLLLVPGIIKLLSYSMTWYILVDHPEMTAMQAIDRSMEMMDGRKLKLLAFVLLLFLINIAGFLCCCVGVLFTHAYMNVALAQFYEDIKNRNLAAGAA